jgi:hypothetical protein
MQRIREIQAEIEGLDFEQFKTSPPTYYPFLSEFSVQNIIDAQQTMLTELATWLHDPWESADIYQEWINGKLSKILTKEEVRKKYPDVHVSTKVAGMGALLSVLSSHAN